MALRKCSLIILIIYYVFTLTFAESTDQPCDARAVSNRSVICVCTANYCDTVTRDIPLSGQYVAYVSTEAGLRFNKTIDVLQKNQEDTSDYIVLEVDPATKYQTINGFGGAVTDSAGINWKNFFKFKFKCLYLSYCGDSGIQYNMLRVPIGGTDFSTRAYAYNDLPENDLTLSNFTLAPEDYEYKMPMIKACMAASSAPIHILSATWSPPPWMKSNNNYTGYSRLKKEYLQTYADYHYKFIEYYAKEGIPIWGISTGNEPMDGSFDLVVLNNLGWTLDYLGEWIEQHLGPTIRNSSFKDVKILSGDDQRYTINLFWNQLVTRYPGTLEYLDGYAVHWYLNQFAPGTMLTQAMKDYPDKFVISSEACRGSSNDPTDVELGDWSRAESYVTDIIDNLSHNVVGWIDWNMCLNMEGGPGWIPTIRVDSPIIVNAEAGEFYKQPMFYAMGHFSKFVPRGSQRVKMTVSSNTDLQNIAFVTPNNTIVVVLYNGGDANTIGVRLGDKQAVVAVQAKSFTTIEMLNE